MSQQKSQNPQIEEKRAPWSAFRMAIHAGQQGIAYLILDNGYNYMSNNAMPGEMDIDEILVG